MKLADIQHVSVGVAKDAKRDVVQHDGARRGSDITPQIMCYRGQEPVAMVLLRRHIREEILHVFRLCAAGFAADAISVIFETFIAAGTDEHGFINPRTGQRWADGGMQYEVEHHQAIERGWVSEALAVVTANRAGDTAFTTLPYRYGPPDDVLWDEVDGEVTEPGGQMLRSMVAAMNMPATETIARELAARSTRDERDTWTVNLIMSNVPCMVGLISPATDSGRIATILRDEP